MKTPDPEDISLAYKVIEAVAEGMSLGSALTAHQLGRYKFSKICALYPEIATEYARATEIRACVEVDETLEIADNPNIPPLQARNMIQARQWRAPKFNRKFIDAVDISVTETVNISSALLEARNRAMRLSSDSQQIEDVEAIDIKQISANSNPVLISVDPIKAPILNPFED